MDRHQIKVEIMGHFEAGLNGVESYQKLEARHSKHPGKSTVFKWFKEFKNGHFEFEDKIRTGRPKTVHTPHNTDRIRELIMEDRHITIRNLSGVTKISMGSVDTIIKESLKMKKLKAVWVPHELTQNQKDARVEWCTKMRSEFGNGYHASVDRIITGDETYLFFEAEKSATGAKWSFSDDDYPKRPKFKKLTYKKRMYCLFFNSQGIVYVGYQPQNKACDSIDYIAHLNKVIEGSGMESREILLHDDNARIHRSVLTKHFLQEKGVRNIGHAAYSPDLAPNDFWFIGKIKKQLRGQKFSTEHELYSAVTSIINSIPPVEFKKCFNIWFDRMSRCINSGGEYFEKKPRKPLKEINVKKTCKKCKQKKQ